jgi:hypothetical protein
MRIKPRRFPECATCFVVIEAVHQPQPLIKVLLRLGGCGSDLVVVVPEIREERERRR